MHIANGRLVVLSVLVGALVRHVSAQAAPAPPGGHSAHVIGGSDTVSPRVLAVYDASERDDGPGSLSYLILFRGEAGWYTHRTAAIDGLHDHGLFGTAGSIVPYTPRRATHGSAYRIFLGDIDIEIQYDSDTHRMSVLGQDIELGTDNVVLIDRVDGAGGAPVVLRKLRIDGTVHVHQFSATELLARSSVLQAFVQ